MILETEVNYTVQSESDVKILVAIDSDCMVERDYVLLTSPQKDTIVFEYDYQNQPYKTPKRKLLLEKKLFWQWQHHCTIGLRIMNLENFHW